MKKVFIYTDGASRNNPGLAGWGSICFYQNDKDIWKVSEIGGCDKKATNNQMEILSVIESLKYFRGCYLDNKVVQYNIYSDSNYVCMGVNTWIYNWKKNGWKNSQKKTVENIDMWREIDDLKRKFDFKMIKVKGHSDNIINDRADKIATEYADIQSDNVALYKGLLDKYLISLNSIEKVSRYL